MKLTTHIGKPIHPEDYRDVEAVRAATVQAMQDLIEEHQTLPGSVARAIKERIDLFQNPFVKHYDFVVRKIATCVLSLREKESSISRR